MQSQARFVFKQGFIYGVGNIITKLSGVILLPLYHTFINENEFGVFTLFETFFQFILILSSWGVKGGFMRWYFEMKSQEEKQELFFTTWIFNFATSLLAVVVIGIVLVFFSFEIFKYEISYSTILYFLAGSFFRLLYDIPFHQMKLEQKAVQQTKWLTINIFLLLGFTYFFMGYKGMGLKGIYVAQFLSHLITFMALIPFSLKQMSFKFKRNYLSEMIHYGFPLAVSNILTTVLTLSNLHILNQYQNLGEVAGYSMAYRISNLVQMVVIASIITSYSNYFFKTLNEKDCMNFYSRFTRIFLLLVSLGGLVVILFSPEIMMVISAGSEFYNESVILIPVLIAGLIFSGWRQLLMLPLNKHKKTGIISLIMISSAVLNILISFALIPRFGKMGASISAVIAQFIAMLWFIVEVKKLEKVNLHIFKFAGLMVIWSILVITATQFLNLPNLMGWFINIICILAFIGFMFLFKILHQNELFTIFNLIKTGRFMPRRNQG